MKKKSYYTDLILKYLSGKIQSQEQEVLDVWLNEHKNHRKLFRDIQSNWHTPAIIDQKTETAYQQLARRLGIPNNSLRTHQVQNRKSNKVYPYWIKLAASITGFLILSAITYQILRTPDLTIKRTGYGETATYILPDSSVITLNANSSLEYADNWQQPGVREVWLDGEAFFQITRTSQNTSSQLPAKFIVHTPQIDVEVLGTKFNVQDRRGKTTVVLNSGKVVLNSNVGNGPKMVMQPGDYVELSETKAQFDRKVVDPAQFSSWMEHKLIMDNTTLGEIAPVIEDYFGLTVKFDDNELANKALTGSIPTDSLDKFLAVLSASTGVQIQIKNTTLLLRNNEDP